MALDVAPGSAIRRAPFSSNPEVGVRGQRTQQSILDATLRVFDAEGYHQCTIERIAKEAGCSRASFYQYFASKEALFRHVSGEVARQLHASTGALDPVGPDAAGRASLRAWLGRQAQIYECYEPVYQAFDAAAESDQDIAGGAARFTTRSIGSLRSKLAASALPARQIGPVIALLQEGLSRTRYVSDILRAAASEAYPVERIDDALADVWHRTLFGRSPKVNVHPPTGPVPPVLAFDPAVRDVLLGDDVLPEITPSAARTRAALLEAGRGVLIERGYLPTRIDDIAAAVGVSHGVFYRYFDNKAQMARLLAFTAMRTVSGALVSLPTPGRDGSVDPTELQRWLRQYNEAHQSEAAMFRVWVEATLRDPSLETPPAPPLDWGRRQMVRFLEPRGFGDVHADAVVLLALIEAFGSRTRTAAEVDAASLIITRGLLGRERPNDTKGSR